MPTSSHPLALLMFFLTISLTKILPRGVGNNIPRHALWTVKTLTDASVRNYKVDVSAFRPSIIVGVPAVWESIHKGIAKVNSERPVTKTTFNSVMNVPVPAQLGDSFLLSNVRAAAGGRRLIPLNGGLLLLAVIPRNF